MDRTLLPADRFVFADDTHVIDDEITLFSNVNGQFPLPRSDGNLFMKRNGRLVPDDFAMSRILLSHPAIVVC